MIKKKMSSANLVMGIFLFSKTVVGILGCSLVLFYYAILIFTGKWIVPKDICNSNNKNTGTEIEVEPENQKSKAAKSLEKSYLHQGWATAD